MHSVNIVTVFALVALAFTFAVNVVYSRNVNEEKPRLFGYSYTTTVIKPHIITSFIPSSCVQIDATLPPCRIMRGFTSFPSLKARSMSHQNSSFINATLKEESVQTTPLSWGEYLGIYAPTVTVTSTQVIVTTVVDPGVQVTYAIRGCKPKVLPSGLERCPFPDQDIKPTKIIDIQPTSTLSFDFKGDNQNTSLNTTTITSDNNVSHEITSTPLESSNFEKEDLITVATPVDGLEDIDTTQNP